MLGVLGEPRAASAASPSGSQFQVNTYTTDRQVTPVDRERLGGQLRRGLAELREHGQRHRRASPSRASATTRAALAIGGQFQVNTYTTDDQDSPSVASDSAGNFVVVWQSYGSAGSDTSASSVQGQRYDASGSPIGGQFQVNTYTTSDQIRPSVASDSAGNFVVVWQSNGSAGSDTSGLSVQGQRYDASGSPIGGEFQVNTYTTADQYCPSVASDSAGNFVVVWQSNGQRGQRHIRGLVQGQRYDASGSPLGGEFQVNTYTTNDQIAPVGRERLRRATSSWYGRATGARAATRPGTPCRASATTRAALAIGGEFQVNTYTTGHQCVPSSRERLRGQLRRGMGEQRERGQRHIRALRAGPDLRCERRPDRRAVPGQHLHDGQPALAVGRDRFLGPNFVVVWDERRERGQRHGSEYSVQGQRYLPEPSFVPSAGAMLAMVVALARRRQKHWLWRRTSGRAHATWPAAGPTASSRSPGL